MQHIPPERVLMQTRNYVLEDEDTPAILIGSGVFLAAILALAALACYYSRWQYQRLENQKRKYADWTKSDGILPEFHQLQDKPSRGNPLHLAIQAKNLPLVQALIERKIQFCDHVNQLGHYALYYAAGKGSLKMARYVAEHTPKDFRPEGRSPLHEAARKEDYRMLSYLVKNFPEWQENRDGFGNTYLKELSIRWIGTNYAKPHRKAGQKYSAFIDAHQQQIPKELLQGLLFPYRDLSDEEVAIDLSSVV